ncbi:thioredoxin family protein [Planctomycetales bacterium ZRK34]|nr:thioredoxin family protein [Planctomycetales bacterium ZRK34]
MVRVESTMLTLGTQAPDFELPNTHPAGPATVSRSDFAGKPLLVAFICNHCPFVKHIAEGFAAFAGEYQPKGLAIVAIQSNDIANYPDDNAEKMTAECKQRGYDFPYLLDESQQVAHAYRAACTPDFFLFDKAHKLVYRGQFDETRPTRHGPGQYDFGQGVTGKDLRAAADAALAGDPPLETQYPSAGCNIKWKPGNEPGYFSA